MTTVVTTSRCRRLAASRIAVILTVLAIIALPGLLPLAAAGEPGANPFLVIRIDSVDPETVTTTSDPLVTVTGTVTNVGDRPVRDVVARLERAPNVASSAALRTDLTGPTTQFEPVGTFITVAAELQRAQAATFSFRYPLRAPGGTALGITSPGVYPLLVNVNGTPDYGEPARLDDARFLLPVLGLPREAGAPDAPDTGLADVVAPDTSKPVQLTMLWPLADRPRLAPGVPGGTTPVRLMDDELATSLAAGGRLDTLLGAAEFATSGPVDPDGAVTRSLCLAVDPDLLVTVNAMTAGYTVADSPDGLGAASHPGAGQAAAIAWLDRLRALAARMCVVATPYAQVDLDALQRVNDPALSAFATTGAADLVDQLLGVQSVRGTTLLGDGTLTTETVDLLSAQGNTAAVAAADATADTSADSSALTPKRLSAQVVTVPFDPAVGAALAAAGEDPGTPNYLHESLEVPLQHESSVSRRQDAAAAMLWRSLNPDSHPRSQILMPPLRWQLSSDDAQAILTTLATAVRSGLAEAQPLPAAVADASAIPAPPDPTAVSEISPQTRFDDDVINEITGQLGVLWPFTAALTTNHQTGLTGVQYTAPLREDMLRALSQAEQPEVRNTQAGQRLAVVGRTINDLIGAVTIVNPGGSYTLATERSPLPLALRNDLAVPIRVRLLVTAPPGMSVTDIGEQELPPGYLPVRVPIEVHFTQRVAVDVALRTPDGLPLGEPVRLSVHSNAYGKVLFFITISAGAVLIALTARRLWHRFRGEPDRADLDRPDPDRSEPAP